MKHPTTWRCEIADAMREAGDPGPLLAVYDPDRTLDKEWDRHWAPSGMYPIVWTAQHVYLGIESTNGDYAQHVPRHPLPNALFELPDGSGRMFDPVGLDLEDGRTPAHPDFANATAFDLGGREEE